MEADRRMSPPAVLPAPKSAAVHRKDRGRRPVSPAAVFVLSAEEGRCPIHLPVAMGLFRKGREAVFV